LRNLALAKTGLNKLRAHHKELKVIDFEDSLRSVLPGEWCLLVHKDAQEAWLAYVNPMVAEKYAQAQIVSLVSKTNLKTPFEYIESAITKAFKNRERFKDYEKGCRAFYGSADGLPGLIIDIFQDAAIIQINTAGLDNLRNEIRKLCEDLYKRKCFFLDNEKYREKESLPTHPKEEVPDLEIFENGLKLKVRKEVLQKVGFYYDHRENRSQLIHHLTRLNKKFTQGVDLFSYVGAWGLSALKAGVEKVDFVDQGDFKEDISECLKLNGFEGQGQYFRGDVFRFLDESTQKGKKFDLVMCDPPAFAKSALQKPQALEGYSKLHRKVFRSLSSGALVAFSSCTHYVTHDEFQKNILEASQKEGRKIQLLYCGMQGWDHPVTSLADKSNYIKSYFYIVE
jgi:23S rRNA (cytosine1962-C5)-methyltransferase